MNHDIFLIDWSRRAFEVDPNDSGNPPGWKHFRPATFIRLEILVRAETAACTDLQEVIGGWLEKWHV